jgi:hypothetical protein
MWQYYWLSMVSRLVLMQISMWVVQLTAGVIVLVNIVNF